MTLRDLLEAAHQRAGSWRKLAELAGCSKDLLLVARRGEVSISTGKLRGVVLADIELRGFMPDRDQLELAGEWVDAVISSRKSPSGRMPTGYAALRTAAGLRAWLAEGKRHRSELLAESEATAGFESVDGAFWINVCQASQRSMLARASEFCTRHRRVRLWVVLFQRHNRVSALLSTFKIGEYLRESLLEKNTIDRVTIILDQVSRDRHEPVGAVRRAVLDAGIPEHRFEIETIAPGSRQRVDHDVDHWCFAAGPDDLLLFSVVQYDQLAKEVAPDESSPERLMHKTSLVWPRSVEHGLRLLDSVGASWDIGELAWVSGGVGSAPSMGEE